MGIWIRSRQFGQVILKPHMTDDVVMIWVQRGHLKVMFIYRSDGVAEGQKCDSCTVYGYRFQGVGCP